MCRYFWGEVLGLSSPGLIDAQFLVQRRLIGDEKECGLRAGAVAKLDRGVARRAAGVGLSEDSF